LANYNFVASTGVVHPDTVDLLAQVQDEFKAAFGSDLSVNPETPQGVLIAAETAARDAVVRNNCDLANQINPNLATGLFLDAVLALTGMQRIAATKTLVVGVSVSGVPGTFLPAGIQAATVSGDLFNLVASLTLDASGVGVGDFQADLVGPVACAPNTLTQIKTPVLGWETVSNPQAGIIGTNIQSDAQARAYRRQTLGAQGVAVNAAITSALYQVDGVHSLSYLDNPNTHDITVGGVTVSPNSMYVCVQGGTDSDIANTLLAKKSIGCNWNGEVLVNITDPVTTQVYAVRFARPLLVPVLVEITVKPGSGVPDVPSSIRQAILDYANGEIAGEPGFVIGASVSPFELAGAINQLYPSMYIKLARIARVSDGSGALSTNEIALNLNQLATVDSSSISVITL